jgi:TolB-like protein/DNA-binding winged helix-turn-helix (wHTH) protein/Flp pilus assembly protein TadD
MRESCNRTYQFGAFQLEPDERRLMHNGEPVSLTPKAFDTLVLLVERAGHLVEKEELMKALWPDSFVEEANLAQYVWTLRKTLGETEAGGQFIETVARKGFRFVAPVVRNEQNEATNSPVTNRALQQGLAEHVDEANTDTGLRQDAGLIPLSARHHLRKRGPLVAIVVILVGATISLVGYSLHTRKVVSPNSETILGPVKTIAVLPFKPLSADSRNESLEMGMTETLITHLSNLRQLVVRPMGAVRKYIDPQLDPVKVGQDLQVDAVLDGSIQKVADRVRVSVRLTNVRDGTALWAQQFDEKFTDIFAVQDSISERVANTLPLKLDGAEQQRLTKRYTESPDAYQLYLQAQYLWDNRTEENRQKMFQYYQQAIERDPKFALAYVGMADLQITLVGDNQTAYQEVKSKIAANLAKALELDSELAQARNLLAEVKYQFDFDWVEAEKEFKKAIELNPNVASIHLAYGWYLMSLGRFKEATREMERAQELDPHSMVINRSRGRLLYFMHDFDQAIQHFQRIAEAEPQVPINHWVLAEAYEQKGMYAEAVEEHARAGANVGPGERTSAGDSTTFRDSGWHAYLQMRKDRMMEHITEGYVSPITIASLDARLGNKDDAFRWLEKGVDERASGIPNLKVDPVFGSLHSDPRWVKLLQRMNLTP